jgi:hypothetical protein
MLGNKHVRFGGGADRKGRKHLAGGLLYECPWQSQRSLELQGCPPFSGECPLFFVDTIQVSITVYVRYL